MTIAALLTVQVSDAVAAPTELCDGSARLPSGFEIAPNVWNSKGELCVSPAGDSGFTVSKSSISYGNIAVADRGPGAYPYIGTPDDDPRLPMAVNTIGKATTSWSTVSPDSGSYNAAYDLWYAPSKDCGGVITSAASTEVMVWLKSPNLDPPEAWRIGSNVQLSGMNWDVFEFIGPTNQKAIIYQAVTPVDQVTDLQLAPITQDSVQRGKISGDGWLCKVQAGFEIHDAAPVGLATTSFSFDPAGATAAPAPSAAAAPTGTAAPTAPPAAAATTTPSTPAPALTTPSTPTPTPTPTSTSPHPTVPNTTSPKPSTSHKPSPTTSTTPSTPKPKPSTPKPSTTPTLKPPTPPIQVTAGQPIYNGIAGLCLDNRYGGENAGNPVVGYHCNFSAAQLWQTTQAGKITLAGQPQLCLTAAAAKKRAKVSLQPCDGRATQQWKTTSTYQLTGAKGLCLDLPKTMRPGEHGTQLIMWPCHRGSNQMWITPKAPKPASSRPSATAPAQPSPSPSVPTGAPTQ